MEIVDVMIERLPDDPKEPITWVVYNDDHVNMTRDLIDSIKGESYCDKYCNVVSRQDIAKYDSKFIYYDPRLMDHLGNGAN